MKYEAVFGDQSLFDGAPSYSTHATKGGGFYMATEDGGVQYLSRGPLNGDRCEWVHGYLIAERRIIAEPKRWTVEDQKAGRLPEVGAFYDAEGCRVKHLGVGAAGYEDIFHFEYPSGACGCSNKIFIKPIESPEEKAARLREEWCSNALDSASILSGMREYDLKRLGGYIGNIYDALLSGDLPVPVKE